MDAKQAVAGIAPPSPENEKAAGEGGSLIGATVIEGRLSIPAESVKREADHHFMLWLKTGIDYYRRLARAASDAARKASP
jgi:hypothetical protein